MLEALVVIAIVLSGGAVVLQVVALVRSRRGSTEASTVDLVLPLVEKSHDRLERAIREELSRSREEMVASSRFGTQELHRGLKEFSDGINLLVSRLVDSNEKRLDGLRQTIEQRLNTLQVGNDAKHDLLREQALTASKSLDEAVRTNLNALESSVFQKLMGMSDLQKQQIDGFAIRLDKLTETNGQKLDAVKDTLEQRLQLIQQDNSQQLERMRATVDEKLQTALEKRLGESFKQVSERLEQVHKGLGEMQSLASGVGDLKKVLTNVKTRGTWGEVQLGALLEQVLPAEQYVVNAAIEGGERVEFAIKFPGRGEDKSQHVLLPVDAKFPIEDYQRLLEAQERADVAGVEDSIRGLERSVQFAARQICSKYIRPPTTMDFGIMFLPTEGLFAEVLRRTGLCEQIQRECRVIIAGPTTLWSLLSSLQMGFRSLAIEKRSSEVWNLLSAVKTEFANYGEVMAKVQKKLNEASNVIDRDVSVRARKITKQLRGVESMAAEQASELLGMTPLLTDRTDGADIDD